MPTASGRTMTSRGPGGAGSGTSSTTITPGDVVTAASICAGHSLRQAPLRVLVKGASGQSHPPAGRAGTPSPNRAAASWVRPQTVLPAQAKGTSPAGNLTIISPGVLTKVVYLPGAGHGSGSRLARTAWSARLAG